MSWLTTEPPKDTQFLADVGLPYAVVAAWNENGKQFFYADFFIGMKEKGGAFSDSYFANDYEVIIKKWMPLPEIDCG